MALLRLYGHSDGEKGGIDGVIGIYFKFMTEFEELLIMGYVYHFLGWRRSWILWFASAIFST